MQQSLFSISADLEALFDQIEELGGELTPELEEQLRITQDQLESKLSNYVKAVKFMDEKLDSAKKEKDRIVQFTKSYINKKERLINVMTDAVERYGETSKAGSKFIELGFNKLMIRTSQVAELREDLIAEIKLIVYKCLKNIYETSELGVADFSIEEMVTYINNTIINDETTRHLVGYEEHIDPNTGEETYEYSPITEDDLSSIDVNISINVPLLFLLRKENAKLVETAIDFDYKLELTASADKTSVKSRIKDGQNITICTVRENKNLQIK